MTVNIPDKAFILAAGFGTRLRPYTDHCPKPMVQVNGRSLIYRTLDRLALAGVSVAVVNMHYMADILQAHLEAYQPPQGHAMRIIPSFEDEILDTGGGVVKALQHFEDAPFFVIAGDGLWTDGQQNAFEVLACAWDDDRMDIVTLMQPLSRMVLTRGAGDFDIAQDGRALRSLEKKGAYMWTNIRLNHPRIYEGRGAQAFSFLPLMDEVQSVGRFYALEHEGDWHHISTPQDLERVNEEFTKNGW